MCRIFKMPLRESNYTTLMMATGLTFGTISALFGLNNGYIDQAQYSVLVTVVIASAVIPTMIAQTYFRPDIESAIAFQTMGEVSTSGTTGHSSNPVESSVSEE